jgi:16S rRNA (adenine1518-N6/adenine1519-N6)-dimethyltransferase
MRHVPRRRFSQNFLVDSVAIDDIVASIAPQPQDALVEIGPGLGALTRPLAARVDALHVIEIDRDIVARLEHEFAGKNVVIHAGDVLDFDFAALGRELRIVGNLPYNISSAILFHLAAQAANIRDIHVMLQQEVVTRMAAAPGDSEYSRLSVMLQYRFEIEQVLHVPADAFRPAPKVESAVVRLTPLPPQRPIARDESLFTRIVAAAFSQRRKTLRNTLKPWLAAEDFSRLAIDPRMRAQELAVEEFVRIADDAAQRQAG